MYLPIFGYVKWKGFYKLQSACYNVFIHNATIADGVYMLLRFKQLKLLNDTADKSWVVVVYGLHAICYVYFFHGSMNGFNVSPFKWPFHISKPLVSFKFRITHLIYGLRWWREHNICRRRTLYVQYSFNETDENAAAKALYR